MKFRMKDLNNQEQKVITNKWIYFSENSNYWDNVLISKQTR